MSIQHPPALEAQLLGDESVVAAKRRILLRLYAGDTLEEAAVSVSWTLDFVRSWVDTDPLFAEWVAYHRERWESDKLDAIENSVYDAAQRRADNDDPGLALHVLGLRRRSKWTMHGQAQETNQRQARSGLTVEGSFREVSG